MKAMELWLKPHRGRPHNNPRISSYIWTTFLSGKRPEITHRKRKLECMPKNSLLGPPTLISIIKGRYRG